MSGPYRPGRDGLIREPIYGLDTGLEAESPINSVSNSAAHGRAICIRHILAGMAIGAMIVLAIIAIWPIMQPQ